MYSKAELQEILSKNTVSVVFTKKDGTERNMFCTLDPQFLPAMREDTTVSDSKRPPNDSVVAVWDLDIGAWRSFRLDSIKAMEYEPSTNSETEDPQDG